MLMVACLEMTSGDSGVSSAGLSLARSCHQEMCMSGVCSQSSGMHQHMDSLLLSETCTNLLCLTSTFRAMEIH